MDSFRDVVSLLPELFEGIIVIWDLLFNWWVKGVKTLYWVSEMIFPIEGKQLYSLHDCAAMDRDCPQAFSLPKPKGIERNLLTFPAGETLWVFMARNMDAATYQCRATMFP
jgi:hypothetical protein